MKSNYDAFISYASEDSTVASELAGALKANGFRIWYAPSSLEVGNALLDSIEEGLSDSKFGILIISKPYLNKGWPGFEMDVLIRQYIETAKRLLPIWHGVTKQDVEARHPGLAGIVALHSNAGTQVLISKLTQVLAEGATTRGVIPSWESPILKFLNGKGELHKNTSGGRAFTLWLALEYFEDEEYPVAIEGRLYDKATLTYYAAEALASDEAVFRQMLGDERFDMFWQMCADAGFDPSTHI